MEAGMDGWVDAWMDGRGPAAAMNQRPALMDGRRRPGWDRRPFLDPPLSSSPHSAPARPPDTEAGQPGKVEEQRVPLSQQSCPKGQAQRSRPPVIPKPTWMQ